MLSKAAFLLIAFVCLAHGIDDRARYDNYRIYKVTFKTEDQVKIFQEMEARSDSYIFIGHARSVNQSLSILTAAHKIAEITDVINVNKMEYQILVSVTFLG